MLTRAIGGGVLTRVEVRTIAKLKSAQRRPETAPAHNRAARGDSETALLTLKSWRAKQRKDRSRRMLTGFMASARLRQGEADHLGGGDWQQIALAEDP